MKYDELLMLGETAFVSVVLQELVSLLEDERYVNIEISDERRVNMALDIVRERINPFGSINLLVSDYLDELV